jgi:GDP-L-fucose synthase
MKVFVTGGTGFLGSHLTPYLRSKGCTVTAPPSSECNVRIFDSLCAAASEKYDLLFHLAAWTQAGDFCLHHPGEQWIINQEINTNVLRWWHEHQSQAKMVAIGTSCCYQPGTPHREENFLKGDPIESLYTYAMTKRMLLVGLQSLQKQFGLRYLYLIPSTLFGPGYHLDGRQMHFIFDLLRKIVNFKRNGEKFVLWGDGNQKRELIHVSDFVDAAWQLTRKVDNDLFNIGEGAEHPIRWYAELLANLVGVSPDQIEYDTSRYVGAQSKVLVIDKLRAALPDFTHTPVEKGLSDVVQWYLKST